MTLSVPRLSVVVPVHQGAALLPGALEALAASDLPRSAWELVVVDDASTDATSLVAARHADMVVRLAGAARGPAYARNRGFEASRGDVVVFVDPDVRVAPDALRRFDALFAEDAGADAAFASLDPDADVPGTLSRFHHLLRHWIHTRDAGEVETFWSGCGAVRRRALLQTGLFDEWHYTRPEAEDVELGRRLHAAGHRIVLRPEIRAARPRPRTLVTVLRDDFARRAVPRAWLLHHERRSASTGMRRPWRDLVCSAAVALATLAAVLAVVLGSAAPLAAAALSLALVAFLNRDFYALARTKRGLGFAALSFPLHLLCYAVDLAAAVTGRVLHALMGAPPARVDVAARLGAEGAATWPPHPARPPSSLWTRPVRGAGSARAGGAGPLVVPLAAAANRTESTGRGGVP